MSDYLVILLVGCLGLLNAGWWVVVVGAVGLSVEPWMQQWQSSMRQPTLAYTWAWGSRFAAPFLQGLIVCAASYLAGVMGSIGLKLLT